MNDFINICKPWIIDCSIFFTVYLIGYSIYFLISLLLGIFKEHQYHVGLKLKNRLNHEYYTPISILVPTSNDEEIVTERIASLLKLNYKLYEIIMIDDGSKDHTIEKLIHTFHLKKIKRPLRVQIPTADIKNIYQTKKEKVRITLIEKEKSGRADTLNVGINACDYPYFTVVDCNNVLKENALENIMRPVLEEENAVVCSGISKITTEKNSNSLLPNGIIAGMKALTYSNLTCAKENLFNEISGGFESFRSFDLFRKDVAVCVGGYSGSGDNFYLKRSIYDFCKREKKDADFRLAFDAVCQSITKNRGISYIREEKKFIKSKRRTILKYKKSLLHSDHLLLSILSMIYVIVYQLLSPIIEIIGGLAMILACIFQLVEIKSVFIFMISLILFYSTLTFSTILMRSRVEGEKQSSLQWVKSYLLCIFETTILKIFQLFAQILSFFPSREYEK